MKKKNIENSIVDGRKQPDINSNNVSIEMLSPVNLKGENNAVRLTINQF
jgi:hypothetical protein